MSDSWEERIEKLEAENKRLLTEIADLEYEVGELEFEVETLEDQLEWAKSDQREDSRRGKEAQALVDALGAFAMWSESRYALNVGQAAGDDVARLLWEDVNDAISRIEMHRTNLACPGGIGSGGKRGERAHQCPSPIPRG